MVLNKKGMTVPSIIAGLVIAFVLIFGMVWLLTGGFRTIAGVTDTLPSALAAKAEVCKGVATSQVAYCEFTKTNLEGVREDSYINCAYNDPNFKAEVASEVSNPPTCSDFDAVIGTGICNRAEIDADTLINGKSSCQDLAISFCGQVGIDGITMASGKTCDEWQGN